MDFSLSEEHRMVRQMVREFAERELAPRIPELDAKQETDPALMRKMGEVGILGICFPEKYGGGGLDYISLAIASEEVERIDTAWREVVSVHTALCGLSVLQWGSEEQKQKYLPKLASGEYLAGFGLTEPNAGSDAGSLQTTARREGDYYVLNGEKAWISLADVADVFLVFAKTDPSLKHKGVSAFLVERSFEGFSSETFHNKMGVRSGNTGALVFQDCKVPAENLVGEEGEGFKIAMGSIDNGRLTVAAGATGLTQACLEASVKYAQERKSFGKPIGEHQLVQRLIAHMARNVEAARLLTYRAAWMKNQGVRNTRETAMAKWYATDVSWEAAGDAVQIHGAYGYSAEYPVERYLRNAKGAMIYEGTREIQELLQGQYALGLRQDRPLRKELPAWPYEE